MTIGISIDDIYNAVQEYKAWCKKHGYNPEFHNPEFYMLEDTYI